MKHTAWESRHVDTHQVHLCVVRFIVAVVYGVVHFLQPRIALGVTLGLGRGQPNPALCRSIHALLLLLLAFVQLADAATDKNLHNYAQRKLGIRDHIIVQKSSVIWTKLGTVSLLVLVLAGESSCMFLIASVLVALVSLVEVVPPPARTIVSVSVPTALVVVPRVSTVFVSFPIVPPACGVRLVLAHVVVDGERWLLRLWKSTIVRLLW